MKHTLTVKLVTILIACFAINLSSVEGQEVAKKVKVEKYPWTLGYKPDQSIIFSEPDQGKPLKLNVFYPEDHEDNKSKSCVILFFGGGWSAGDPSQFYGYSKYLASRGVLAIAAQYRTAKSHQVLPRNCVEDGKAAVRYVRAHAKEWGVDPDKIVVGGGSAGGHVAASCSMCPLIDATPESEVSCIPNALMLFNPVYDNGPGGYGHARVKSYWEEISPMHNIQPGVPPTIIFFGDNDVCVPVKTMKSFQKKMEEAGNVSETHIYEGQRHGFFHISKGGRKLFEDVLTKVDAFLVKNGFISGANQVSPWTEQSIERFKAEN